MRELTWSNVHVAYAESIGICGEPPELKHLSRVRKRHQHEIPLVVASERGRGQTGGALHPRGMDAITLVIG